MKVYIAAPISAAALANFHAARLRVAGFAVTSTWHSSLASTEYPSDPEELDVRRRTLLANVDEIVGSDRVLVETTVGTPRATYGEVGFAIGIGLRAVWIQGKGAGKCLWDSHPSVIVVGDLSSAIEALR